MRFFVGPKCLGRRDYNAVSGSVGCEMHRFLRNSPNRSISHPGVFWRAPRMQIVSFWRCFNIAFSPPGVDKRIRLSNHSVMCNDSSPLPSIFYPQEMAPRYRAACQSCTYAAAASARLSSGWGAAFLVRVAGLRLRFACRVLNSFKRLIHGYV